MEINLTRGETAKVSHEDYLSLSQHKWFCLITNDGLKYAVRWDNGKLLYMHRVILGLSSDCADVDHRDRNGLNNDRSNLRICTKSQNQANRKKFSNNSSGFIGVEWDKDRKKWKVVTNFKGKRIFVGRFENIREAATARDIKVKELFGDFASLNL